MVYTHIYSLYPNPIQILGRQALQQNTIMHTFQVQQMSSSSELKVQKKVLENGDLLREILFYVPLDELLDEIQFINHLFYQVVPDIVRIVKFSSTFSYLKDLSSAIFVTDKKIVRRIVSNRTHYAGGFLLLGGSFGSFDKTTYWIRDNPNEFEGVALPGFDLFESFGSSSMIINKYGELHSFCGWEDENPSLNGMRSAYRTYSFYDWMKLEQSHTMEYRKQRTVVPFSSDTMSSSSHRQIIQSKSFLPEPRCYTTACTLADGQYVYLLGGCSTPYREAKMYSSCLVGTLTPPMSNIGEFDYDHIPVEDLSWRSDIITNMQVPRGGHGMLALPNLNNNLMVVGGYGGGLQYHRSVEIWDWDHMAWLSLPSMNECRSGMAIVLGSDNAIYVVGGSPDGSLGHRSLERYDPREGKRWTNLASMLLPRGYITGAMGGNGVYGGHFYVTGGLHEGHLQGGVEYYDIRRNAWAIVPGSCSTQHSLAGDISATAHISDYPIESEEVNSPTLAPWFHGKRMAREGTLRAGFQLIYTL